MLLLALNQSSTAQNLPWRLPPTQDYLAVEPFSEEFTIVQKKVKKEKRWFFMDKTGKLSTDHYAEAYPISNGLAAVFNGKVWKFRKSTGAFLVGEYDYVFDFYNGVAIAKKNAKWGVLDVEGNPVVEFEYDNLRPFSNNWAGARKGNKVLIINSFGNELDIPYTYIHAFSEGLAAVTNQKGEFAYIDTTGAEWIPLRKGRKFASNFFNGLAAVSDTLPHLTFIDKKGKPMFSFKNGTDFKKNQEDPYNIYQHQFVNGLAAVRQQGKWGFIDTLGRNVIPYEYEVITPFSEGFAAVKKEGKWLYINEQNKIIQAGDFEEAKPCTEGVAWVKTSAGWGLLGVPEKLNIIWDLPSNTQQNSLKVALNATCRLDSMRLECNGQLLKMNHFTQTALFEHQEAIPLQTGKLVFQCTAWAGTRQKTTECVLYRSETPVPNNALTYSALLIGNSNYDTWGGLANKPIKDADSLASILYEHYQFKDIQILHNATLAQMHHAFRALTERKNPNERLLIFYAGHGDQEVTMKPSAYLVPVDAQDRNRKTQFSAASFINYVKQYQSEHILFIADACFAGSFVIDAVFGSGDGGNRKRGSGIREKENQKEVPVTPTPVVYSPEKLKSRHAMSSGQKIEVPNASVFIEHLFKNLLNNPDAVLSADDLFTRLKPLVMRESQLVPQFGKLHYTGDEGGDFLFRKKI
jgi:Caspase domain/WG containing repeat